MGTVVLANHNDLDQTVAIKVLSAELSSRPDVVARFMREARAAAKLQSEHVTRVTDVGTFEGVGPYIVMEHLTGHDLQAVLDKSGRLPVSDAVDYVIQAIDAIAEAHALGIIHRDLKLGNLFLADRNDGSRTVKVLDFGVSKLDVLNDPGSKAAVTQAGVLIGSPEYMSPEQLMAEGGVDARSDVWALGVVLYELLTGNVPFRGTTVGAIMAAVLLADPKPVRAHRSEIPAELDAVVMRCLQRDLPKRMPTVVDLARGLAPFGTPRVSKEIERAGAVSRRMAVRKQVNAAATFRTSGTAITEGTVFDVSTGGCFLATTETLREGAILHIEFQLPTGPVNASGLVAWARTNATPAAPAGVGIKFTQIEEPSLESIRGVVLASPAPWTKP